MLNDLLLALLSAAVFRGLYLAAISAARSGLGPSTPPFISRYVSGVHALALVALGLWPAQQRGEWWVSIARALPLGYLAHDTHLLFVETSVWDLSALIHHCVFAVLVSAAAGPYPDHTAQAFLAELSVPFLNAGWVMLKTGNDRRHPWVFRGVSIILLPTFLKFRVLTFTYFTIEAVVLREWLLLGPMLSLAVLNWYWFVILVRRAVGSG